MSRFEDMTPERQASVLKAQADAVAVEVIRAEKQARRDAALAETPASVNDFKALRDEINALKALLRGDV